MRISGIVVVLSLFLLSGCISSQANYLSTGHNVPLVSNKGQVSISGDTRVPEAQTEVMINYSVTDVASIYLGTQNYSNEWKSSSTEYHYFEGGPALTYRMNKPWVSSCNLMLGKGSVHQFYGKGETKANFIKYAVQPAFGISFKYLDFLVSYRFSTLNYTWFYDNGILNETELVEFQYLRDHSGLKLEGFAFTLRLGFQRLKMQLQIGGDTLTPPDDNISINGAILDIGIIYYLHKYNQ